MKEVLSWDEFVQGVIKAQLEGIDFHIKKYSGLMEMVQNFNKLHSDDRLNAMNEALEAVRDHLQTALEKTQELLAPGAN